ncbi:MAG: hypothetical protein AAFS04_07715 [Cyanobacteria bacterium J06631_9]
MTPSSMTLPSEIARKVTVIDDGLDQGPEATSLSGAFPDVEAAPTNPVNKWIGKLGLGKSAAGSFVEGIITPTAEPKKTSRAANKSATSRAGTRKTAAKSASKSKSTRKSKKAKAAEAAKAEAEAAEAAVAQRFREEDQSAYFSLVYKTGISALVWAVLMLLRHELSADAIAIINIVIHPLLIATVSLVSIIGLTFWLRRLVNDLAKHTTQLNADAEETDGKNYRPTLEIVGDALEYNPRLRRNISLFFDAASTLICTLISYLITSAVFLQ